MRAKNQELQAKKVMLRVELEEDLVRELPFSSRGSENLERALRSNAEQKEVEEGEAEGEEGEETQEEGEEVEPEEEETPEEGGATRGTRRVTIN